MTGVTVRTVRKFVRLPINQIRRLSVRLTYWIGLRIFVMMSLKRRVRQGGASRSLSEDGQNCQHYAADQLCHVALAHMLSSGCARRPITEMALQIS